MTAVIARLLASCVIAAAAAAEPAVSSDANTAPITISLDDESTQPRGFEVRGLTPAQLERFEAARESGGQRDLFAVTVDLGDENLAPPMLGKYEISGGRVRFLPRFPLQAGQTYVALLRLEGAAVRREFRIAEPPPTEPTSVVQVFPTGDLLPENLLRLYVEFSAPMARGDSYRHVRLTDAEGREADLPFVEFGEELWNPDGTRLTLLFDPGRIKRGVKPREDLGPVLAAGKTFTLVIDPAWRDAAGRPLRAGFRKTFRVGPPDARQPDPNRWEVAAPPAGTREPLAVRFDEPLDHAMLKRLLTVAAGGNVPVRGSAVVERDGTLWRFRPDQAWTAGRHRVVVETILEDLAGNSLARPFEVDPASPPPPAETTTSIPFDIPPPP